jgi:hypothetical protein
MYDANNCSSPGFIANPQCLVQQNCSSCIVSQNSISSVRFYIAVYALR